MIQNEAENKIIITKNKMRKKKNRNILLWTKDNRETANDMRNKTARRANQIGERYCLAADIGQRS